MDARDEASAQDYVGDLIKCGSFTLKQIADQRATSWEAVAVGPEFPPALNNDGDDDGA